MACGRSPALTGPGFPALLQRAAVPARFFRTFVGFSAAFAALVGTPVVAQATSPSAQQVDVALVIAVDVSWSMDHEEQMIQRNGYAAAFRSKGVIDAIMEGNYGRVAVTYVEWAGQHSQATVVPWTVLDSADSSKRFADALNRDEPLQLRRTSISGAIDYSRSRLDMSGFKALRRVVDISGDGPNNEGRPVTDARDEAVAAGIAINGLPLMTNTDDFSGGYAIANLDDYYSQCVIGGPQAFVIPVTSWKAFPEAVRRKLVLELAGLPPDALAPAEGGARVVPVQAKTKTTAADCQVGEQLWGNRRWNSP